MLHRKDEDRQNADSLELINVFAAEICHLVVPGLDSTTPLHPVVEVALEADEEVLTHREPACKMVEGRGASCCRFYSTGCYVLGLM